MPKPQNYVLTWEEEHRPSLGEGISRTSKLAPFYQVTVTFPGMRTMKEWLRASNKKEALRFCTNKYPSATDIHVIGRSNPTI